MLNNSLKREGVKATGAILAASAGGPVAITLSAALGVAVEALGLLGVKRTNELFDSEKLINDLVIKINQSDVRSRAPAKASCRISKR